MSEALKVVSDFSWAQVTESYWCFPPSLYQQHTDRAGSSVYSFIWRVCNLPLTRLGKCLSV